MYNIRLSKKESEKFYLEPNPKMSHLDKVEFKAKSPEDRSKWFVGISTALKLKNL
jgi:hypothetical protein